MNTILRRLGLQLWRKRAQSAQNWRNPQKLGTFQSWGPLKAKRPLTAHPMRQEGECRTNGPTASLGPGLLAFRGPKGLFLAEAGWAALGSTVEKKRGRGDLETFFFHLRFRNAQTPPTPGGFASQPTLVPWQGPCPLKKTCRRFRPAGGQKQKNGISWAF